MVLGTGCGAALGLSNSACDALYSASLAARSSNLRSLRIQAVLTNLLQHCFPEVRILVASPPQAYLTASEEGTELYAERVSADY